MQFVIFKLCKVLWTFIKIPIVKLGGYSRKFSQRQCKIQISRGNLVEQKFLESAFSGFQRA